MNRSDYVGNRAYHEDSGGEGIILDVHLDIPTRTAKFMRDNTDPSDARWVNLSKLKVLGPPSSSDADAEF